MGDVIIIAPHFDDEIIGNYQVLMKKLNPIIVYMSDDDKRKEEALSLPKFIDIKAQMFQKSIPTQLLNRDNTLFFPDPYFEKHFLHREIGMIGEKLVRDGYDVIFYSVNMEAPYVSEVADFKGKRHLLEKVYPSQKNLWCYENKYFIWEGKCKWII